MSRSKAIFTLILSLVLLSGIFYSNRRSKIVSNPNQVLATQKVLSAETNVASQSISLKTEVKAKRATEISSGIIFTDKGDDLLVLVNKHISLRANYEPSDLVYIDGQDEPELRLRREAAAALKNMTEVAGADGVTLEVISAYRSYWQQVATIQSLTIKSGAAAQNLSAEPGHSQHQLGTAVDFANVSDQDTSSGSGAVGGWLARNSYKFGFVLSYPKGEEAITGYDYEPWHYRYIGVENASEMVRSGMILEEFLQKFGVI